MPNDNALPGLPDLLKPMADTAGQLTAQLNIGVKSLGDNLTKMTAAILPKGVLGLPPLPELPPLPGMPAGNPGNPGHGNPGNPGKAAAGLPVFPGLPDMTKAITSVEDVLIPQGLPKPSAILAGMAAPTPPTARPTAPAGPAARPASADGAVAQRGSMVEEAPTGLVATRGSL
ncbi:MAG: hypothetical protein Q8O40_09505 [Chloroflexota bacterium]|nr:hypothetical protein [Chloroflexota bacterium]